MNENNGFVASLRELRAQRYRNVAKILSLQKRMSRHLQAVKAEFSLMNIVAGRLRDLFSQFGLWK